MQQSFRHYPSISKNGNIIILKYADLNRVLAWLIKKILKSSFLNMQTCFHFWICRLFAAFLQTCFFIFADLLLHFMNMQTFCRLFWRLAFFIFADLLLNMQTFCRHFADLFFFFYDFWIGFSNLSVAKLWVSIELFSENLWRHILVFWKVFKW